MGSLYLLFRNFHLAIGTGLGLLPILWRFALDKSWTEVAILVSFLLVLGMKRLLDEPYMRKIKKESGW